MSQRVTIVGGGLAGSECALQLALRGVEVTLVEQKPNQRTPAQSGAGLAELVCSNSFRGAALGNAVGLLKEEMRRAGSAVIAVGDVTQVPAGGAMAVDREFFGAVMTALVLAEPAITVRCEEITAVPDARPLVLATGPLTGDRLAKDLAGRVGGQHLAYYDAIAPVVATDSIDFGKIFRASRYDKGGDDAYLNCPLDENQYHAFVRAVIDADTVAPHDFEEVRHFEGCLPLEVMAKRGPLTLAYGPMKPVGLRDPKTGQRPFAVVQLRQEDAAATAYNLVGFQSRMKHGDQQRVLRMIPGLENAEFMRLGTVHRNTFVNAPEILGDDLSLRADPGVFLAGQITGVEGYVESAAIGLLLGIRLAAQLGGALPSWPGPTTAMGALVGHLRRARHDFQPSNVVWAMFPPCDPPKADEGSGRRPRKIPKRARHEAMAARALEDLGPWLAAAAAESIRERLSPRVAAALAAPVASLGDRSTGPVGGVRRNLTSSEVER